MANFSALCLAQSFQELYTKSGTDFTVICNEEEIPVHSFVLCTRSSVFQTAINGHFKEKEEKKLKIDEVELNAVEEMIRFLYGFEISKELDNIEELLALADMYQIEDLKAAIVQRIPNNIKETNVFDILDAAEKYSVNNASDMCVDFIMKNYTIPDLVENGMLDKFPQMAVALLKKQPKLLPDSVVRLFKDTSPSFLINYDTTGGQFKDSIQFTVDTAIVLSGIGLFLSPLAPEIIANIRITNSYHNLLPDKSHNLKNTQPESNLVRVPVGPVNVNNFNTYIISVDMKGKGVSAAGSGQSAEVIADGLNKKGQFVKRVKFTFKGRGQKELGQIPELYFHVI